MGAEVTYSTYSSIKIAPLWLVETLGDDYFGSVTSIRVSGFGWHSEKPENPFDVSKLCSSLSKIPSCKKLSLEMVGLTDDGIAKLEPISNQIEELSLREVWSDYMGPQWFDTHWRMDAASNTFLQLQRHRNSRLVIAGNL